MLALSTPVVPQPRRSEARVLALDGLRGLAIIAVMVFHYALPAEKSGSLANHVVFLVAGAGWTGVDLFFVLSGFLITGILFDTQNDPAYYKKFYIRRALRIFPIYYLFLFGVIVFAPLLGAHFVPAHLAFLVYLGYPASLIWSGLSSVSPLLRANHLWSLCCEEQFYLAWPWIVAKCKQPSLILRVCLLTGVGSLLLRVLIVTTGWLHQNWAEAFLLCRMDGLTIGAAIAILVRERWKEGIPAWIPLAFVVSSAAFVMLAVIRQTSLYYDPAIATVGYSFIAVAFGSLLLLALNVPWLERVFALHILRIFGKYSYGLYLYHFPMTVVLQPWKDVIVDRMGSLYAGSLVYLVVCFAINLAIAVVSFHAIEAPILELKSRFKYV